MAKKKSKLKPVRVDREEFQKKKNSTVTKYVYGLSLVGEEKSGVFKTYHYDYRVSTVVITDMSGNVTDTLGLSAERSVEKNEFGFIEIVWTLIEQE